MYLHEFAGLAMKARQYARKTAQDMSEISAANLLRTRPFQPSNIHSQQPRRTQEGLEPTTKGFDLTKGHPFPITSDPSSPVGQPLQAKLTVGAADDKYEREADHVASQVVDQIHSAGAGQPLVQSPEQVSRKPQMRRASEVQRSLLDGGEASSDLESAINRSRGSGQPLDSGLQASMGQVMGTDFSQVRVHTGAQADALNQSIQAKAFTTGQDVFFRQGEYQPRSRSGQELIAHELTHVVQQSGGEVQHNLMQFKLRDATVVQETKPRIEAQNRQSLVHGQSQKKLSVDENIQVHDNKTFKSRLETDDKPKNKADYRRNANRLTTWHKLSEKEFGENTYIRKETFEFDEVTDSESEQSDLTLKDYVYANYQKVKELRYSPGGKGGVIYVKCGAKQLVVKFVNDTNPKKASDLVTAVGLNTPETFIVKNRSKNVIRKMLESNKKTLDIPENGQAYKRGQKYLDNQIKQNEYIMVMERVQGEEMDKSSIMEKSGDDKWAMVFSSMELLQDFGKLALVDAFMGEADRINQNNAKYKNMMVSGDVNNLRLEVIDNDAYGGDDDNATEALKNYMEKKGGQQVLDLLLRAAGDYQLEKSERKPTAEEIQQGINDCAKLLVNHFGQQEDEEDIFTKRLEYLRKRVGEGNKKKSKFKWF